MEPKDFQVYTVRLNSNPLLQGTTAEDLNGCHWYSKAMAAPQYIFEHPQL